MAAPEAYESELNVPPELEGGVYANVLKVWHSKWDFTLDFGAATEWPAAEELIPSVGVARIRISVPLLFDVLKALNDAMTQYEDTFGEIR